MCKTAIEERRGMADENKAMSKLLAEENKIMMMNRNEMNEVTKEWHDGKVGDLGDEEASRKRPCGANVRRWFGKWWWQWCGEDFIF